MNKVILLGNLTRDPETNKVTTFGLAHNETYKGEKEVLFVDCVAFGKTGETIQQYFRKGSRILVEGKLKLDQWTSGDGQKRSKLKVIVWNFEFIDRKTEKTGIREDEIPF